MRLWESIKKKNPVTKAYRKMRAGIFREAKDLLRREEQDRYWRRLTGDKERDLSPMKQDRMIDLSVYVYRMNPLARRQIELMKDFVIGDGITYDAENDRVKKVLDGFWKDPINIWPLKQHDRVRELSLYGEQFYRVFVNKENGHVKMGAMDPKNVASVESNPKNDEDLWWVHKKTTTTNSGSGVQGEDKFRIIHEEEDPESTEKGRLVGDMFFFYVNKLSNGARGTSDLLCNLDWLDGYDRTLFAALEYSELSRYLIFHLIIKGATPEQVEEKRLEWQKNQPKPGGSYVSSDEEDIKAVGGKMTNADLTPSAKLFKSQIIAGAGIPEHYFGIGENVNRASAKEMGAPVLRMIKTRQTYIKWMISFIFVFVIDQARIAGRLSGLSEEDGDFEFTVKLPDPSPAEIKALTEGLNSLANALATAVASKLCSLETAQELFRQYLAHFGIETTKEEEEEQQGEEKEKAEGKDYDDVEKKKKREEASKKSDAK